MLPRTGAHAIRRGAVAATTALPVAGLPVAAASACAAALVRPAAASSAMGAMRAFSSLRDAGVHRATACAAAMTRPSATVLAALPSSSPASASASAAARRGVCTSRPLFGLEEFFSRQQPGPTGRSWEVRDLRQKGWLDLQRLWFVLLKERNMLLTYRHQCRTLKEPMVDEHRLRKVRQSMSAIKAVLGERYRHYKAHTDQGWVERQARIARKRRELRVRDALRRSPTPHTKPRVPGGLKPWQLTNKYKYALLKPRPADVAPPTGQLPAGMRSEQQGHGQAPEDLFATKIKRDKEYV